MFGSWNFSVSPYHDTQWSTCVQPLPAIHFWILHWRRYVKERHGWTREAPSLWAELLAIPCIPSATAVLYNSTGRMSSVKIKHLSSSVLKLVFWCFYVISFTVLCAEHKRNVFIFVFNVVNKRIFFSIDWYDEPVMCPSARWWQVWHRQRTS